MRIVLEVITDDKGKVLAEHVFHTEDTYVCGHPTDDKVTLTPIQFITLLAADPALREKSGWHKQTQQRHESKPTTIWERLVTHTNSPEGHPELKKLNLRTGD